MEMGSGSCFKGSGPDRALSSLVAIVTLDLNRDQSEAFDEVSDLCVCVTVCVL